MIKNEYDYLYLDGDKAIKNIIKDEIIQFSDKVIKINRFGMNQERVIMITNKGIYNLKKKELKRKIEMDKIRGITISKLSDEFVLHGTDFDYDYYFVSNRKKKIIEYIAKYFFEMTKTDIKLFELDNKSLKNVVTLKKEKKKNVNFTRMPEQFTISLHTFLYGTKQESFLSKKSATIIQTHSHYKNDAKLDDFKVIKIIGRGSFGKVSLVENVKTEVLFAMKSLKKDILLYNDQVKNTLQEKKILQNMDNPFLVNLEYCFQTDERIYFIMPFLKGGELFQHLKKQRIFDEYKYI